MRSNRIVAATHYLPLDSSFVRRAQENSETSTLICTNSERWSKTIVRLPLFVDLEQVELDRVINAVNSFVPVSLAPADECYWEEILQIRNNNSECSPVRNQLENKITGASWQNIATHTGLLFGREKLLASSGT